MSSPKFPVLPFDAVPYVLRQRTRLQRLVSEEYYQIMAKEFATLKPYIPEDAKRILDIGGGLGGVHMHVSSHFQHDISIEILDRIGMDEEMKFGFRESTEKYNDPDLTRTYLASAGVPPENIVMWDADTQLDDLLNAEEQYDIIISLKSWCYHYPYSTYREFVRKKLSPAGVMIVDVRRDKGQIDDIESDFDLVGKGFQDHTLERLAFAHKR